MNGEALIYASVAYEIVKNLYQALYNFEKSEMDIKVKTNDKKHWHIKQFKSKLKPIDRAVFNWMSKWVGERVRERASERVSEWVSEWVSEFIYPQ